MVSVMMSAVAAHFGRDVARTLAKLPGMIDHARDSGVDLLVLPETTMGGYLSNLEHPFQSDDAPATVQLDGPEVAAVARMAGDMTVCFGIAERADGPNGAQSFNTAVCVSGDGILGVHRKVHLPLGESETFDAGDRFEAFDSPVGRIGMMIGLDKAFPEAARTLALDGAEVLACLCAWPASATDRSDRLRNDRQAHLFDLYDCARAAENQLYVVTANQTGVQGGLRFLGQAKVVDPAGEIVAKTWAKGGVALAQADVAATVARARRSLDHIHQRAEHAYRLSVDA